VCVRAYMFTYSAFLTFSVRIPKSMFIVAFRCHADTQSRQCVTRLSGKQQINARMARTHAHAGADTAQYNCCYRVQERRARDALGKTHKYDFIVLPQSPQRPTRDSRVRAWARAEAERICATREISRSICASAPNSSLARM